MGQVQTGPLSAHRYKYIISVEVPCGWQAAKKPQPKMRLRNGYNSQESILRRRQRDSKLNLAVPLSAYRYKYIIIGKYRGALRLTKGPVNFWLISG
jgi:hypothetical protein